MGQSQKPISYHRFENGKKRDFRIVKPNTLSQILKDSGSVTATNMRHAIAIQKINHTPLERILIAYGWVKPEALLNAQAIYLDADIIDPVMHPPNFLLIDRLGLEFCLSHSVLPWRSTNNTIWVAVSETGCPAELHKKLTDIFGPIHLVLCLETEIRQVILYNRTASLMHRAETCVPATESCRSDNNQMFMLCFVMLLVTVLLIFAPLTTLALLLLAVSFALFLQTILKLTCFVTALHMNRSCNQSPPPPLQLRSAPLPMISIMVPLYKESEIADHLVKRLTRIKYPC